MKIERRSPGVHALVLPLVAWAVLAFAAGEAHAVTHNVGPWGGDGGDWFTGGCPPDQNLGGVELRAGTYIDAIRPVCVISLGPAEIRVAPVQPPFFGGPGGGSRTLLCPKHKPIVTGVFVGAKGRRYITVSRVA
ncbi:MAG: hypothetical protein ABI409_17550, partial [Ramlibacter sp.]